MLLKLHKRGRDSGSLHVDSSIKINEIGHRIMSKKRIILLAVCAVLGIIAIVQKICSNVDNVKVMLAKDSPNKIEITTNAALVTLTLDGNDWYVDNFLTEASYVNNITNCIKEVKVLDKVGTLKSDDSNSRYDLNDAKAIIVKAFNGQRLIRSLRIGKATATAGQSYIACDDSRDILLVSGNYNAVFNKTARDLKNMTVYNIATSDITSVDITVGSEHYGVTKTDEDLNFAATNDVNPDAPKSDKKIWTLTDNSTSKSDLDSDKVNDWVTSLSICQASEWLGDDDKIPGNEIASCKMKGNSLDVTVTLYGNDEVTKDDEGKDKTTTKYYITCSKTTHKAEISDGTATKFKKQLKELIK